VLASLVLAPTKARDAAQVTSVVRAGGLFVVTLWGRGRDPRVLNAGWWSTDECIPPMLTMLWIDLIVLAEESLRRRVGDRPPSTGVTSNR